MLASLLGAHPGLAPSARAGWPETIDRVSPAVVVIQVSAPRAFDVSARGPGTNDPMYIVEATRV